MNKQDTYIPIDISITSETFESQDSDWQEECRQLYQQLNSALDDSSVEPSKIELEDDGHRGGLLEVFTTITAGISSIGGLSVLIEIVKLWMDRRKGSEVTLKFPDGSNITLSGASKSEVEKVLELYEKQLTHPQAES